ncbi:MAG: DUF4116 domain-containing protein, partial [Alphaproteobacteria bacterium]|nr:DUF4116 domain-containing protein [Candidatus Fonsibacter sp. PEL55]
LQHVHKSLRKDKSIVLQAIRQNGSALEFADQSLKKDKLIVLKAVNKDSGALKFVDESIKKEIEDKRLSIFQKRLVVNRKKLNEKR